MGTFLGVSIIRIMIFWGSIFGSPIRETTTSPGATTDTSTVARLDVGFRISGSDLGFLMRARTLHRLP